MNSRNRIDMAMFFLVIMFAGSAPAHAYIDPVTGSIILQAVVGGVAALLVAVRRFRDRVIGLFKRKEFDARTDHDTSL